MITRENEEIKEKIEAEQVLYRQKLMNFTE